MSCSFAFTHYLKDAAVYWAPDEMGSLGTRTFIAGRHVCVKWFDRADVFRKTTGEEAVSSAVVLVGEDMEIGGYLWLGNYGSLSAAQQANPQLVSDAKRIEGFEKTGTLSGGRYARRVFL